jgi:hypothetical protein
MKKLEVDQEGFGPLQKQMPYQLYCTRFDKAGWFYNYQSCYSQSTLYLIIYRISEVAIHSRILLLDLEGLYRFQNLIHLLVAEEGGLFIVLWLFTI